MAKGGKRGAADILVWSEIVSADELERRRKRLLDVRVSNSDEDGADIFVVTAEVASSAEEVYALVDWADDRNRFRQMGDCVTGLDEERRRFRLVIRFMPDVRFDYEVVQAEKPTNYEYECIITPPQGHLGRSREHFRIEPLGNDRCAVTMTVRAYFDRDLSAAKRQQVIRTMTVGAHNGLAKLKAFAEYGVGTIEAAENLQLMSL